MKLSDLKELVDAVIQRQGGENLEVVIPNHKPSMGGLSVTKVKAAIQGIDWDSKKFFIFPENEMIERENTSQESY